MRTKSIENSSIENSPVENNRKRSCPFPNPVPVKHFKGEELSQTFETNFTSRPEYAPIGEPSPLKLRVEGVTEDVSIAIKMTKYKRKVDANGKCISGLSPKVLFPDAIVKHDSAAMAEFLGAKCMRRALLRTVGFKCLAPENSVLAALDGSIFVHSKLLEGFRTLYSERQKTGEIKQLRKTLSPELWQQFLKYYFLSFVVYCNNDLHDRNIGIVPLYGREFIAGVDFGHIFCINPAESPQMTLNAAIHMLKFWHGVGGLQTEDVKLLVEFLSDYYRNRQLHITDFDNVFNVIKRDCEKIKVGGVDVANTLWNQPGFSYKPNCEMQSNPLMRDHLSHTRPCKRSLETYLGLAKEKFLKGIEVLPGIIAILKARRECGINTRQYLKDQEIDIDFFQRQEEEREKQNAWVYEL